MQEVKISLKNEEETLKIAFLLALFLKDYPKIKTILLFGDLGAGKTTFVRGFVSAFEDAKYAEVSSPTFTLVNQYPTKPPVFHADIYRLAETCPAGTFPYLPEELEEALEDFYAYTLIEWAEFLDPQLCPTERLDIFLKIDNNTHFLVVDGNMREKENFLEKLQNFIKNN